MKPSLTVQFLLEGDSSSPSFSIMYLGSKMPRHNLAVWVVWHAYNILIIIYVLIFFNLFYRNCREFCDLDLLYGGGYDFHNKEIERSILTVATAKGFATGCCYRRFLHFSLQLTTKIEIQKNSFDGRIVEFILLLWFSHESESQHRLAKLNLGLF